MPDTVPSPTAVPSQSPRPVPSQSPPPVPPSGSTISSSDAPVSSTGVTVKPLATLIGAELTGIDIAQPLDSETVAVIQRALNTWKVVFFRDQELDHAPQIAFGRQFGDLTYAHPHGDTPSEDVPESYGGDTTFTNLVAAYQGLSDPVRAFVDTLWAEHRYGANWSGQRQPGAGYGQRFEQNSLVTNHPVVRVDPVTGERALFVNPNFVDHIVDVSPVDSRWILEHLFAELTRPEYTVRFHWEPGSVAFWDNRTTAHLGLQDVGQLDVGHVDVGHLEVERVLHRITVIGDVPVGPDGRESELAEGAPFVSTPVYAASTR